MVFKFEIKQKESVYRSLLFYWNKMDSEDNLFMEMINSCSAVIFFKYLVFSLEFFRVLNMIILT
jgi:hypothetical protein